jgi:hypothetical protein
LAGIQVGRDLLLRDPAQESSLPSDFASLAEVYVGMLAFQDHYQLIATHSRGIHEVDLELLLKRLAAHEPDQALAA